LGVSSAVGTEDVFIDVVSTAGGSTGDAEAFIDDAFTGGAGSEFRK